MSVRTSDDTPAALVRPIAAGRRRIAVRRRRRWRLVLLAVGVVVLGLAGYYLLSLYQVWSTGRGDQTRPVDAIVVMGAAQYDGEPSPQLAARLDHVVELWPQGYAPLVVVTGGKRPEDRFTEAETSAAYLIERGVPADAIVMEDQSTNTDESLAGVARCSRSVDSTRSSSSLIRTIPCAAESSPRITAYGPGSRRLGPASLTAPSRSAATSGKPPAWPSAASSASTSSDPADREVSRYPGLCVPGGVPQTLGATLAVLRWGVV